MNFVSIADFVLIVGEAQKHQPNPIDWPLYNSYKDLTIRAQTITALEASNVFALTAEDFKTFIHLIDGDKTPLPFNTARVLSGSFIKGLLTRLVVDDYHLQLNGKPVQLVLSPNPKKDDWQAESWILGYLRTFSEHLQLPDSWDAVRDDKKNPDYAKCLSALTDSTLQAAGIVAGWKAGDTLLGLPDAQKTTIRGSILTLLHSQFTTREVGMAIGYSLCYLAGYISSERSIQVVEGKPSSKAYAGPDKLAFVFESLGNHIRSKSQGLIGAFEIANKLFALVVAEFYIVATDPQYNNNTGKIQVTACQDYQAFLLGFERGLLNGAELTFTELFNEAYGLGYSDGFRDGYSQGYAAGWQDGYRVGYNAGSNQGTWLNSLHTILGDVGTALGDLNTVLSDAKTAGTVITALFA
jgi:hypothetical protein